MNRIALAIMTGPLALCAFVATGSPPSLDQVIKLPAVAGELSGQLPINVDDAMLANRAGQSLSVSADFAVRAAGSDIFARTVRGVVKVVTSEGEGSGVVLSDNGLVLTNWHVIEGHDEAGVIFYPTAGSGPSSAKVFTARVIKLDGVTDLALLKLKEPPVGMQILRGAESLPRIGADVHAIGHPRGQDWSYTRGYVSQIRPDYEWTYSDGTEHRAEVIQTQTPINPGNSGGPLFDEDGALIGINSFGQSDAQGLNYAVSINTVQGFLRSSASREPIGGKPAGVEPRVLRVVDLDKDGKPDGQILDFTGDGKADALAVDTNGDGQVDQLHVDSDGNGQFNFWVVKNPEGGLLTYYDNDEDGQADAIGYDKDGDGEDEYIKPVS